jgi:hypothetical protein
MAIKRQLHVKCTECGVNQRGMRVTNGYWFRPCNCKGVPGPSPLPYIAKDSDVIWIDEDKQEGDAK